MSLLLCIASVARAGADADRDGLGDAYELALGTDPAAWDTDLDTVPDGAEVLLLGSDPLVDDSQPCLPWAESVLDSNAAFPSAVVTADVDGDGHLDVVAAAASISWYSNRGGGAFSPPIPVDAAASYVTLGVGDLDGDGDVDVLAASSPASTVDWYENLGGGLFGPPNVVSTTQAGPSRAVAADLDGDGDADVLAGSTLDDELAWYENLGGGVFGPEQILTTVGDQVRDVGAADFDGDGLLDVWGVALAGDEIAVLRNRGSGSFDSPEVWSDPLFEGLRGRAADVDADGDTDLLVVLAYGLGVYWLENTGGALSSPQPLVAGFPAALDWADVDGDGAADLVLAEALGGVEWYRHLGGTSFAEGQEVAYVKGEAFDVVATGDLDGDGDPDVVSGAREVAWYRDGELARRPDEDGISIEGEQCLVGTDPMVFDTDGGGVGDGEELLALTDPLDPSDDLLRSDADGDGASNVAENYLSGTDPDASDTDADGLDDGEELGILGTDPRAADTDGDTAPDAAEVYVLGTDPLRDETLDCPGDWTSAGMAYGAPIPADLDGDGDVDLLLADWDDALARYVIAWYPNLGGGTFGSVALLTSGLQISTLFPADLDGDGDVDVLAETGTTLLWLPNLGGGAFGPPTVVSTVAFGVPGAVVAGDLDGDGDLDLVSYFSNASVLDWYENLGGGAFGPARSLWATADASGGLQLADVDGDGDLDPVCLALASDHLEWTQNLGGGAFAPVRILAATWFAKSLGAGDLDGDGADELVVGGQVDVRLIDVVGGVGVTAILDDRPGDSIAVGDWDLDGDSDLVVDRDYDAAVLFENRGAGAFAPPEVLPGAGIYSVGGLGDVDGDGDLDLAAEVETSVDTEAQWLANTGSDVDGDGLTEAAEVCLTGTDPAVADSDHGGASDLRELQELTDPLDPSDDVAHLGLSGPFPGIALAANTWTATGAVPGTTVVLEAAKKLGSTTVPGCPGLFLALDAPAAVAQDVADAGGVATLQAWLPATGVHRTFQAVDTATCVASAPLTVVVP